ncbi:Mpo1-like protein [Parapusillimonas sp. JC17]|uniref:Mpo1-like protein n=1 Tax=Parapusillimonas sp. JC17 TaxID=3445768 RepID=UPI003FA0BE0D
MMAVSSILRTQWNDYPQVHASRTNFMVHLATVPVFMAGTVIFFWGVCVFSLTPALAGLLAMMAALGAQGWGHRQESRPPAPFTSPGNALVRLMLEQWVTFPRYAWLRIRNGRRTAGKIGKRN